MYRAITRGIQITVEPTFLEDRSSHADAKYMWAYTIEIANLGDDTVQLLSRYWRITDRNGRVEEVRGPGVVGEEPVIAPGEAFTYTSGCPLRTPSGIMAGWYQMKEEGGELFNAQIPAFSLDSPYDDGKLN